MKKLFVILLLLLPLLGSADDLKKAQLSLREKKYDQALKLLNQHLQKQPEDIDAHEMIQEISLARGKETDVSSEYKARYEKQPTALNAHLYSKLMESPSEIEILFRKVREDHPNDLWSFHGLADSLLNQDRLQEAAHVAEEGLLKVKSPARLHYLAARIYRRMKEYRKAAEQAGLAYRTDPANPDYKDLMPSYEWIEITETEDSQNKFSLAQQYYKKYKDKLLKPEDFYDAASLTELAYIFAEHDLPTMKRLVEKAQESIRKEKPPNDKDDREMYFRTKGSLFALEAFSEAHRGNREKAVKALKLAASGQPGPEALYFSGLTHQKLGNKTAALESALKAATYPPPYPRSSILALALWKEIHRSESGFEEALIRQKKLFEPQRRKRVLAQMISEEHKDFTMQDKEGKKITKQDLTGKIVLMNFWAVWCPPCREELPHWNAFYAKHKNDPDLWLVTVGDEPWETMKNYANNQDFSFPLYRNEEYWEQFGISGIPTLLVIDPKGKIRFRNVGFEKGMEYEETLEWQIDALR